MDMNIINNDFLIPNSIKNAKFITTTIFLTCIIDFQDSLKCFLQYNHNYHYLNET